MMEYGVSFDESKSVTPLDSWGILWFFWKKLLLCNGRKIKRYKSISPYFDLGWQRIKKIL